MIRCLLLFQIFSSVLQVVLQDHLPKLNKTRIISDVFIHTEGSYYFVQINHFFITFQQIWNYNWVQLPFSCHYIPAFPYALSTAYILPSWFVCRCCSVVEPIPSLCLFHVEDPWALMLYGVPPIFSTIHLCLLSVFLIPGLHSANKNKPATKLNFHN